MTFQPIWAASCWAVTVSIAAFLSPAWAQTADTVLLVQASAAAPVPLPPAAASPLQAAASVARKWSVYWGWNRSTYSNSDIHFWGPDHNFTLSNVKANDLQADVTTDNIFGTFLNPANMTLPQTNLRVAYQVSPDTAWAINLDHMKYVVTPDQTVAFAGSINNDPQSGSTRTLSTNYLNFEHTDGLNVVTLEYEKQFPVTQWKAPFASRWVALVGAGIVYPKTNVTLNMLGRSRNDQFHLAGYSAGGGVGWEADFLDSWFFRSLFKMGYVTLPDVLTSSQGDKASHNFTYNELLIAVGKRF
ncbi:MAG: hypothetical protein EBQ82_07005 [Betaproteobacteria bacterium]|nr:hypothetical protein [Betaproteobacteria bacterium]NBY05126.1 hypothetical protein [Betaproteobacteria bacterium]